MKILSFDTTNNSLSVAVLFDNKVMANADIFESGMQAEKLIPLIEECLNKANIWYQDLELLAITKGPGSFTGVRVGFSTAKAIKLGTKIPLIGISSLQAIAYGYRSGVYKNQKYSKILIVMDAKLDEFFIQQFELKNNKIKPLYEPEIIDCKQIVDYLPKENFLLAGSAKTLVCDLLKKAQVNKSLILSQESDFIKATNIALLANELYQSKDYNLENNDDISYIRKPRISKRKK